MEKNTNTIQRISQFLERKGLTINKFSSEIGVSNSYFYKMIRSNGSIGSDILEKITNVYPELSPVWLITGKGAMIITSKDYTSNKEPDISILNEPNSEYPCKSCQEKDKIIEAQQDHIDSLKKMLESLTTMISNTSIKQTG